jgi:hypothetical protein
MVYVLQSQCAAAIDILGQHSKAGNLEAYYIYLTDRHLTKEHPKEGRQQ